jgi:F1F0 ATPase subunit 2
MGMNSYLHIGAGLLIGVLLGAFFYGGLWWTIARFMTLAQPAWLIFGSFLLRTLVAVTGFYIALRGGWPSLVAALITFLVTRIVVTRLIDITDKKKLGAIEESMS